MKNDLITIQTLMNSKVVTPGHQEIGVVEDVAIHKESGRVAYVLLKTGSFLGIGEKKFPIPYGALYTDTRESDKVILDVDKERLENAPVMDLDEMQDFNFADFIIKVYQYYGVKPYLTDYSGELEMDLSNDPDTNPASIRQGRVKGNRFNSNHRRAHDRHTTHVGLGIQQRR
jgi:sporulation protein YlmC with PRC-barrel domain